MNNKFETNILKTIEEVTMASISMDCGLLENNFIDSIMAVDLALRIEEEFYCTIPPQEITVHMRTCRTLVNYIMNNTNN